MKTTSNLITVLKAMRRHHNQYELKFEDKPMIDILQVYNTSDSSKYVVQLQDGCGRTKWFEMSVLTLVTYFSWGAISINLLQRLVYENKILANELYANTVILDEEPFTIDQYLIEG